MSELCHFHKAGQRTVSSRRRSTGANLPFWHRRPGVKSRGCAFGESNGGLIDSQPSGDKQCFPTRHRSKPVTTPTAFSAGLPGSLSCRLNRIFALEKHGSHQLGKVSFRRGKRRANRGGGGRRGGSSHRGNTICGRAASLRSAFPAGNLPNWRM